MSHQDDTKQDDTKMEILPPQGLSRRDFLTRTAGTTAGLYALTQLESSTPARAQSPGGGFRPLGGGAFPTATQQLPFWGDTVGWDKPEYYETLQAGHRHGRRSASLSTNASLFSQNRDALLIRGPAGLLINSFDPGTGQWMQVPDGPALSDPALWFFPFYYSTIQTADIDGDDRAEILARAAGGLWAFKYDDTAQQWNLMPGALAISDAGGWNNPAYYNTLQCANVTGDTYCQLMGRGGLGLYGWKYDTDSTSPNYHNWVLAAHLPDLADTGADGTPWFQPEYYSSICYGDLDGGGQEIVIARGINGILAWAYDSGNDLSNSFDPLPAGPEWSDADGWNKPEYYSTIQTAYLGLGTSASQLPIVSLVGRGPDIGLEVWTYDAQDGSWFLINFTNSILTDADGWNKPEYYSTIQFADIDGDGIQELLVRGPQGLQAVKVQNNNDGTYTWALLPPGPAWSDANGWNQVQYYSSIQTANSLQQGDPGYSGGSAGFQAVVLARNKDFVETWTYNPTTRIWSQTTNRAYPAFTGNQLVAYNYITTALGILETEGVGIRARYNDETGVLQGWIANLLGGGIHPVHPPSNVSSDDWTTVKTQILYELTWVNDVQYWFGTLVHGQIVDTFLGDQLTIYTVGPYLTYSSTGNSNVTLTLSILGLIAGALAAALGFPELEAGAIASIVGVISYTFSAAQLALPGQGGAFQADYSQLQQQLANGFDAALTKIGTQLFGMTGGGSGAHYVSGDYGLLSAIGQMIETTVWDWPTDTTAMTALMQRGYAIEVWKVIFNAYQASTSLSSPNGQWAQNVYNGKPDQYPDFFPDRNATWYGLDPAYNKNMWHWLTAGLQNAGSGERDPPPTATLQAQFDPPVEGQVFPLGVPVGEFYLGQNGWPTLWRFNQGDSATGPVNPPTKLPALGVDLNSSVSLSRNSDGTILVSVSIINRGLTAASNVEITDGRLNIRRPMYGLPTQRTRIKPGKTIVQTVTFPNLPKGVRGALSLSGSYLGRNLRRQFPRHAALTYNLRFSEGIRPSVQRDRAAENEKETKSCEKCCATRSCWG